MPNLSLFALSKRPTSDRVSTDEAAYHADCGCLMQSISGSDNKRWCPRCQVGGYVRRV